MALNPQNLIPPVHTTEEARRRGRNGGIKSGESKRMKKTMRELAEALLDTKVKDEAYLERLKEMGFKTKGLKMNEAMIVGQMLKAMEGDPRCFQIILDLVEPREEIKLDAIEDLTPLGNYLKDDTDGQ